MGATTTLSESELGRRLHAIRGVFWELAVVGDPYADLLRGHVDPRSPEPAMSFPAPVTRSAVGTWVVTDPALAATVLTDRSFGHLRTDGRKARIQVLPLAEAGLRPGEADRDAVEAALAATPEARPRWEAALAEHAPRVARALEGREVFDVLADYAVPLSRAVLAELAREAADVVERHFPDLARVPDALVTPQRLDDVLATTTAVRAAHAAWRVDHPPLPLAILYAATAPTAVAAAIGERLTAGPDAKSLRRRPPLRLLHRVAHHDMPLGEHRIAENDQVAVVVDDPAVHAAVSAADPWSRALAVLLDVTVEAALDALSGHRFALRSLSEPIRRPRSPVTRRLVRWEVTAR
ncbi:cytochrome P450 family protein [Saccharomonospora glauca]|jgi:hypothetical protein|uniref:Cytochrome P450 n=1 Tax=Saccharomonospora glauca K62 TaxID=928724 RepID=I1D0R9_9PSEU|nr:hypothetical protein [Saccharomonospora glauca]EIE98543.1 hypothetical protein SacglDRAFT_01628 [Saccharomonospora glauca K62]